MHIDEAETSVVQSELDHHASLEAVVDDPHFVFCDELFVVVYQEADVFNIDEDGQEHLALLNEIYQSEISDQVLTNRVDLLEGITDALLASKGDYVVSACVWEHLRDVDHLVLSSLVPCHEEQFKVDLTLQNTHLLRA